MRLASTLLLITFLASCGGSQAPAGALDLQALRGQWVVINYWAQWCKPCIKEIPELNELDREFDGVTVLGVNYDGETGEELAAQIEKLGVAFTTLSEDPSAVLGVPRPVVLPTTLILDPQGQLDATLVGPQTLASLAAATGQPVEAGHE
jgi:thiol-disulfide isomerase/thioredoxin